jgi:holo-[acyl-carrier protein] synthase
MTAYEGLGMVGVDIVDVSRIGEIIRKYGDKFLEKVFTEEEMAYVKRGRRTNESFAGRFAAKEAFMKANGRKLSWREINVLQDRGRPFIRYHGQDYDEVSISHERAYAVSIVVIDENRKPDKG